MNKLQKHECLLSDDELGRFGESLTGEEIKPPLAVAAIRLIALTGCRKSEILNLAWSEVRGRRMLLHDTKTGLRTVWMVVEARGIVDRLPRDPANDHVFSSDGQRLSMQSLDGCFRRVRMISGLGSVRLHDLRHSFASRAASMSETLPMIAKLLGHSDIKMTSRYAHLDDASLIASCKKVGGIISKITGQ